MVKEGVVVIDVGINRADAPEKGYRCAGDVDQLGESCLPALLPRFQEGVTS